MSDLPGRRSQKATNRTFRAKQKGGPEAARLSVLLEKVVFHARMRAPVAYRTDVQCAEIVGIDR